MVVILHDYGGYPFSFDISYQLSLKGIEVYHIYSSASGSPQGNFKDGMNLKVIDLSDNLPKVKKGSFLKRFIQEFEYGKMISAKIVEINPDIVISSNTPLLAQIRLINTCVKNNIYVVHWLQDLLSLAAKKVLAKKIRVLGNIIGYLFFLIEKRCLNLADEVISISENFNEIITTWGIKSDKIKLFENWAQINEIPLFTKNNSFAQSNSLESSFNIIYTGTLGMKQNPDILLEISKYYSDNKSNVKVIVVASGDGVDYLKEQIKLQNLRNLICFPLQPYEMLPQILGTADLLIATLNEDAGDYCVPSKVLTYYCSGKASFLVVPIHNQAAKVTIENDLGFVVSPNNKNELFEQLNYYIDRPEKLLEKGANARRFAELNFDPVNLGNKFVNLSHKFKYSSSSNR